MNRKNSINLFNFFLLEISAIHPPLISLEKILLPVFHIKSGVGGKILKYLFDESVAAYDYVKSLFGRNFIPSRVQGKQINQLLKDTEFEVKLTENGKVLWTQFYKVVFGFLGRNRDSKYKQNIKKLIQLMSRFGIGMSPKIHLLKDHLDKFPENCSDFSDEAGERFHQDIKESLRRTRHQPAKALLIDYCWRLTRERETNRPGRKPISKLFFD